MSLKQSIIDQLLADLNWCLYAIGALKTGKPVPPRQVAPIAPMPQPEPSKPPTPLSLQQIMQYHDYKWCGGKVEDRRAIYQLAMRICKEEGLGIAMTADLLATIWGESGFNQWCVNTQSKDYGVAQFSFKYYLVEYKMTPEDALNDPEKCLRIMARNFKAGRQSNWVAYQHRAIYLKRGMP